MKIITRFVRWLTRWAWKKELEATENIATLEKLAMSGNYAELELKAKSPALHRHLCRSLAAIVAESPNYTEMKFDVVSDHEDGKIWVTVLVQKGSGLTPHELRREAEARIAELQKELDSFNKSS
jgi:hypothetical protein